MPLSQHELLSSEREDLTARIETLQSNVTQLESQILEMQKQKCGLERDLEAERLLREQKTKVQLNISVLSQQTLLTDASPAAESTLYMRAGIVTAFLECFLFFSIEVLKMCVSPGPSVCSQGGGGASSSAQQAQTSAPGNGSGARAAEKGTFTNRSGPIVAIMPR